MYEKNYFNSKGCVTDSLDIAIAIGTFFSEQQKGAEPAVHHINNLYFLRVDESVQQSTGHMFLFGVIYYIYC